MLVMAMANQEEGQFSSELGHILLTDTQVQNTFLTNIITKQSGSVMAMSTLTLSGFATDKEAYNQFLRIARDRLHQEGIMISTALAPKTSATQKGEWYEGA